MSRLQVGGLALLIKAKNPKNLGIVVSIVGFDDRDGMFEIESDQLNSDHASANQTKSFHCYPSWLMPLSDKQTQDELINEGIGGSMSELISGKDAKLAWANGVGVQISHKNETLKKEWHDLYGTLMLSAFDSDIYEFRLKPRTITINGIEVPAPFEPKDLEQCWVLSTRNTNGYGWLNYSFDEPSVRFGAWRSEEEIKQVVAALRSIFKCA